jgi:hypothetical protein
MEVRMHYYTPAQVLERLPGLLTIRDLIDMTEKGVIKPAIDSSGQGSPRQYSEENLLQIAVASSLRKILPPRELKFFMEAIYSDALNFDMYFIKKHSSEKNKFGFLMGEGLNYSDTEKIQSLFTDRSLGPKNFVTIVLNISSIRDKMNL